MIDIQPLHSDPSKMETAKCQCLKSRSCREYARLSAFLLEVFVTWVVMIMPVACQASRSSMQLNSTLLSNQTLVSPGGVFELGFYSATRVAQVSSPVYTLAIWYAHTAPAKTVVWFPDRALALSEKAFLSLSPQGDLQVHDIFNIDSPQLMWTSNTAQLNGTTATILDTGNFVILNSANDVVWQSFDSPTDTLLPNQSYPANSSVSMKAWRTSGDWSDSPYSLNWSTSNTLTAFWLSNPSSTIPTNFSYWSFPTLSSTVFLTKQGEFQSVSREYTLSDTLIGRSNSGVGVSNRLLRLTLDTDGNLRMYSWFHGSSNWEVEWEAIDDVCKIFGYCGPFALCGNYGKCFCPQGFQFLSLEDLRQGCVRRKTESSLCAIDTTVPLKFTDYVFYGDSTLVTDVAVEDCIQRCLSDCSCAAASVSLYLDSGLARSCWLRKSILFNGRFMLNTTTYLRTLVSPQKFGLSKSSILKLVSATLGATVLALGVLVCVFCGFCLAREVQKSRLGRLQKKWGQGKDAAVVRLSYNEVQLITNDFAVEIGKGGFGTVFKGQIGHRGNSLTDVAVKRLDKLANGEREFVNEVDIIGQIHHFHLVHLLGYCAEAKHRILVYEYVEEGSLDRLLFRGSSSKSPVLEWRLRFKIAVQTARALAYLHDDCDQRIVHCDVKPENILLDSMFRAKVADFGLSRIMKREQTQTITMQVRGTRGYLAPEWTSNQMPITAKTDVFSYGMLLLELISGRRNLRTSSSDADEDDSYFPIWAYPFIETDAFMDVVDPSLTRIANSVEVRRALLVAFWCINDKPHVRPSMVQVVQMLEGHVPVEVPVPRPDFFNDLMMKDNEDDGSTNLLVSSALEY